MVFRPGLIPKFRLALLAIAFATLLLVPWFQHPRPTYDHSRPFPFRNPSLQSSTMPTSSILILEGVLRQSIRTLRSELILSLRS